MKDIIAEQAQLQVASLRKPRHTIQYSKYLSLLNITHWQYSRHVAQI